MEKKQGGKAFWKVLLILSLIGAICALGFVGWYLYQDYQAELEAERLKNEVVIETEPVEETASEGSEGDSAAIPEGVYQKAYNPIDFQSLAKVNPDLYAWIEIPDTKINYPIAQREGDDEFYLHHDMYQKDRFAGCIYTESANSKDFSDPNTLIYGHNMKNKSMFQNLHRYEDYTFFTENPYVYIYAPGWVRKYEVFAAYTYDDRHILNSFDFSDEKVYAQYLEDVQQGLSMDANLRKDLHVTSEDRIITLSTCVGTGGEYRYLVQAVLVSEERS